MVVNLNDYKKSRRNLKLNHDMIEATELSAHAYELLKPFEHLHHVRMMLQSLKGNGKVLVAVLKAKGIEIGQHQTTSQE